ncbi:MAG: outer membrane lipoprotein carrier protein LolA [Pseudomonadales bacterium]
MMTQLGKSAYVEGKFIQERYLQGFSRSLVSSGTFLYWQEKGVYWEIQKPFFHAVTYRDSDIIHWGSNGKPTEVIKTDIVQKLVSRVILAMLSANLERLEEQFYVETKPDPQGWFMVLRPKLKVVAQIIQHIDVVGGKYLQQIDLMAVNGDKTVIAFVNTEESPQPSKEKCQHFFVKPNQACL